jgi:hypothetical protein
MRQVIPVGQPIGAIAHESAQTLVPVEPLGTQVGLMLPVAGLVVHSDAIVQLLEHLPAEAIAAPNAG